MHDAASPAFCLQVDQLLQPHFAEDMARLTVHCGKRTPRGRQTVMVSATLTAKVIEAAEAGSTPCQTVQLPASKPVGHGMLYRFCHAILDASCAFTAPQLLAMLAVYTAGCRCCKRHSIGAPTQSASLSRAMVALQQLTSWTLQRPGCRAMLRLAPAARLQPHKVSTPG